MRNYPPTILLKSVTKTCESCPAQWEGETVDGWYFYARARHNRFTVQIARTADQLQQAPLLMAAGLGGHVPLMVLGYSLSDCDPTTGEMLVLAGAELVTEDCCPPPS